MIAPARRGACPAVSAPMPTGDGLLARLTAVGETISLDAFASLTAASRRHGNGIIEITARGSIQVRGLTSISAPTFAAAVAALNLPGADGVPVIADPLTGLDPDQVIDAGQLAATLRGTLADASFANTLGSKVSVVVDGGSALHLDAIAADVRVCAERSSGGVRLHVLLGGDGKTAMTIGVVAAEQVVEVVVRLLEAIAARGPAARARNVIDEEGLDVLRAVAAGSVANVPAPGARPAAEGIGIHRLRHGRVALGIGLAFGHSDAITLERLVNAAKDAGAYGIRTAPGRVLLAVGAEPDAAPSLAANAERLGFIVHARDPRRYIEACAGAPICASGEISTRALGPAVGAAAGSLLDGSLVVHLSGCAKGCAHRGTAALTIVGRGGDCGVILDGSTLDAACGTIAVETVPVSLARLAGEIERMRRPGERTADTLSRLGRARVTAAILEEPGHG
jgi:precorrin-3B synthase